MHWLSFAWTCSAASAVLSASREAKVRGRALTQSRFRVCNLEFIVSCGGFGSEDCGLRIEDVRV